MKKRRRNHAIRNIICVTLGIMMLITANVFVVSIGKVHLLSGTDLSVYADNQNIVTKKEQALRGEIKDRNGNIIAQDNKTYNIVCILDSSRPSVGKSVAYVKDKEHTADVLSKILRMDREKILDYLSQDKYQTELFPLFHWSFIPWAFYLVLAVVFGFMLHVRKRNRQRYSEACRPIIGKHADGIVGRIIDLFALFALLAGTATTFSVATPLMSAILVKLFGITLSRTTVTIIILLITCVVYTYAVLHGFKGISFLAKLCIYLFFGLLAIVLLIGGEGRFIVENGFQSLGKMFQNFIELCTYTDPGRTTNFPQDWTIYYWAYWMVWSVAAPFFIGNISRGRTIKQTILGGYVFGVGSTIISFVVLGNYSLGLQTSGAADFIAQYAADGDLYGLILSIIDTMPMSKVILGITILCMIAFYATSFDSIAYTAACYSYKQLGENEHPHKVMELLWCVLLIVLPVALVFSESSMNNIQSISIISAFPIGIIMIIMIAGFFKDIKKYVNEKK